MALRRSYIILFAFLFAVGCTSSDPSDSDSGPEDDPQTEDTRNDDSENPPMNDDTEEPDDDQEPRNDEDTEEQQPPEDTNNEQETTSEDTSSEGDFDPDEDTVQSCDDIPSSSCFAHRDCSDSEICRNVGGENASVTCCVEGQSGSKEAGSICTKEATSGETTCKSGLCIGASDRGVAFCSTVCESADDCPNTMKDCKSFPGDNSTRKWCFPSDPQASSCGEIDSTSCFSNGDCRDGTRCEDVGQDTQVPCCVPGERGEKEAGESCEGDDGDLECKTGVCVSRNGQTLCSKKCSEASECPDSMNDCGSIPFQQTDSDWCLPTSSQ
jgi:hypothetical protein